MQHMYLRKRSSKKNPGRHPIGIIGASIQLNGNISIAVALVHSTDNFSKRKARDILESKMRNDLRAVCSPSAPIPQLYELLPEGQAKRLDDYPRHQQILESMIRDALALGV